MGLHTSDQVLVALLTCIFTHIDRYRGTLLHDSAVASLIDLALKVWGHSSNIDGSSDCSFTNAQGSISIDARHCIRAHARRRKLSDYTRFGQ